MRPKLCLTFAAFVTFAAPALPVVLTGTSANAATPVHAAPATHRPRLVIANRKQARQRVRMVPGNFYYNPTPVYSEDCYDLAIQTRANGNYVARVTQHPGKACLSIDHGTTLCPFSIEIDARRGAAIVVGYPYARYGGNAPPRHQALFGIWDAPGIDRISKTDWRLEGTSEHLRYTDQCDLTLNVPAFELMNGYIFTLRAARRPRTLAVSCYANSIDP